MTRLKVSKLSNLRQLGIVDEGAVSAMSIFFVINVAAFSKSRNPELWSLGIISTTDWRLTDKATRWERDVFLESSVGSLSVAEAAVLKVVVQVELAV